MNPIKTYAVFDAAFEPKILTLVQSVESPFACLYPEPVDEALQASAPYLVEVTPEVRQWLSNHAIHSGFYFTTQYQNLPILRHHLRAYLSVRVPAFDEPILLRYYDPRVLWSFLEALTEKQKSEFIAPMLSLYTHYQDEVSGYFPREEMITEPALEVDESVNAKGNQLVFAEKQYQQLQSAHLTHKANRLTPKMETWFYRYHPKPLDNTQSNPIHTMHLGRDRSLEQTTETPQVSTQEISHFAQSLLTALSSWGVTQARSIEGIAQLCMNRAIVSMERLPIDWKDALSNTEQPENYRVNTLLKNELGRVPVIDHEEVIRG